MAVRPQVKVVAHSAIVLNAYESKRAGQDMGSRTLTLACGCTLETTNIWKTFRTVAHVCVPR